MIFIENHKHLRKVFPMHQVPSCTSLRLCCMSREKVSISLDKDEKSLRTFKLQHMVKAVPPTLWRLTSFFCVHAPIL